MPVEIDRVASNSQLEYIKKKSGIPQEVLQKFNWSYDDAWKVYNGLMAKPHDPANKDFARNEIRTKLEQQILSNGITDKEIDKILSSIQSQNSTLYKYVRAARYIRSKSSKKEPSKDNLVKKDQEEKMKRLEQAIEQAKQKSKVDENVELNFDFEKPIIKFEMWLTGIAKLEELNSFQMIQQAKTFSIKIEGPWYRHRVDTADKIIVIRNPSLAGIGKNFKPSDPIHIQRPQLRELFKKSESCNDNKKYTTITYDDSFRGSYFVAMLKKFNLGKSQFRSNVSTDFWLSYRNYLGQFKDENPPDNAPNVYKKNDKLVMNTIIVTPRLLLRPILELLSDGEYHTKAQADEVIADKLFSSTKEEYSKIKTEDSKHSVFYVKMVTAIHALRTPAGLLVDSSNKSPWKITEKGKKLLENDESEIQATLNKIPMNEYGDEEANNEDEIDSPMNEVYLRDLDKDEFNEGIEKIQERLLIPSETIVEILAQLLAGKNILLTGPVGTGKTELARMIPEIFWNYHMEVYTATADWTTHDVIGGITPKMNGEKVVYDIEYGCVTQTVLDNWKNETCKERIQQQRKSNIDDSERSFDGIWLCIDEFNRADIDKAFGQIFTSVETKKIRIPTRIPEQSSKIISIPNDFRIIGTLNTSDKHHLFHLSDALKRRFSIINIDIPTDKTKELKLAKELAVDELPSYVEEDYEIGSEVESLTTVDLNIKIGADILSFVREVKPLGTAVLKSIIQTIITFDHLTENLSDRLDNNDPLDYALANNLSSQLEDVDKKFLDVLEELLFGDVVEFFIEKEKDIATRDEYKEMFRCLLRWTELNEKEIDAELQAYDQGKSFEDPTFVTKIKDICNFGTKYNLSSGNAIDGGKFRQSIHEMKKNML